MEYVEWREKKLNDIRSNPEKHRHSYEDLLCCCAFEGSIDSGVMDAHSRIKIGQNGGRDCDVTEGPCSCGAWH